MKLSGTNDDPNNSSNSPLVDSLLSHDCLVAPDSWLLALPSELQQGTGMIFSDECDALNSPLHCAAEMTSLTAFQMLHQSSDLVAAARSWIPISCTLFCHHTFAKSHIQICKSRGSISSHLLSALAKPSQPIFGITAHPIGCPVKKTCLSLTASGSAGLLEKGLCRPSIDNLYVCIGLWPSTLSNQPTADLK